MAYVLAYELLFGAGLEEREGRASQMSPATSSNAHATLII
jgi:hypothetical protein